MVDEHSFLNVIANSIIGILTYTINAYSGIFQIFIYLLILITFGFTLIKIFRSLQVLSCFNFDKIKNYKKISTLSFNSKTPLSVIAALSFERAKIHYLNKEKSNLSSKMVPPDTFIRDAAFQFSERYFETKFLEPLSMLANLLPPLGFIGTILGMVIQFLSNTGDLKSDITIAGIATALYTTFLALILYTFVEFTKRFCFTLAHKRIDEGLASVFRAENASGNRESNET
jgi:biopolymer transport protein ExbB/TolQ